MDWQALLELKITPEYIPDAVSDEDVSNFLDVFTNEKPVDTMINVDNRLLKKYDKEFENFNFERFDTFGRD
jgi:hypothetical protein